MEWERERYEIEINEIEINEIEKKTERERERWSEKERERELKMKIPGEGDTCKARVGPASYNISNINGVFSKNWLVIANCLTSFSFRKVLSIKKRSS